MAVFGIDVSHHQGAINWPQVAAAGKEFAIVKASEGTTFRDSRFPANRAEALAAGLKVGAYHYYRPGWEPVEQANHFYSVVGDLENGDLIPWLDVEDFKTSINGPAVAPGALVANLQATLTYMDRLFGVTVGIYTGLWFWNQLPAFPVKHRPLWIAYWYSDKQPGNPKLPRGWSQYAVHQYTSSGSVPGISGRVDLNWVPETLKKARIVVEEIAEDDPLPVAEIGVQLRAIKDAASAIEAVL